LIHRAVDAQPHGQLGNLHFKNELQLGSQPKWQGDLPAPATSLEARFETGFFFCVHVSTEGATNKA